MEAPLPNPPDGKDPTGASLHSAPRAEDKGDHSPSSRQAKERTRKAKRNCPHPTARDGGPGASQPTATADARREGVRRRAGGVGASGRQTEAGAGRLWAAGTIPPLIHSFIQGSFIHPLNKREAGSGPSAMTTGTPVQGLGCRAWTHPLPWGNAGWPAAVHGLSRLPWWCPQA